MIQKKRLKMWMVMLIIWIMCFSDWTFAEGESLEWVTWLFDYIISFLSWSWVLFAKLAWIFLTNQWIFWESIWLDALLRRYRNVMKNIANFWLWFYFIYVIFKWLISDWKWSITKNIKNIILWIFIAGIWIQVSRFFTMAVVDVSTITLTAVSSLSSQAVADNPEMNKSMRESLKDYLDPSREHVTKWKTIEFLPIDSAASDYLKTIGFEISQPQSVENLIDAVMPNANDVWWPLYFMWYSILKSNYITRIDSSSKKWFKATILNLILQWGTTIIYAIEMIVLCVLALMRIIYLWMFIIMSPIAILLWCIEKSWQKISWDKWFLGSFTSQINLTTFFINVFKPTVIVLWLWIAVIFTSLMQSVIVNHGTSEFDMWGITVSSRKDNTTNTKSEEWDKTYTTTVDMWVVRFTLANAWKTLLEIILSIITVLIVYLIIQATVRMWKWKDFVSEKIGKVQDAIWWAITSLPVVPVAWVWDKWQAETRYVSAWTALGINLKWGINSTWRWLANRRLMKINEAQKLEISKQNDAITNMRWNNADVTLQDTERTRLEQAWKTLDWLAKLDAKREVINEIRTKTWKWMILDETARDKTWINVFTWWLNNLKGELTWDWEWVYAAWTWLWDTKTLKDLFNIQDWKFAKAYAKYFDLKDKDSIKGWETLRKVDISKTQN